MALCVPDTRAAREPDCAAHFSRQSKYAAVTEWPSVQGLPQGVASIVP